MDNSGKLLGAQINREWFLYQEKEVFAEYRQKRLTIGLPNETERRENRVCLPRRPWPGGVWGIR